MGGKILVVVYPPGYLEEQLADSAYKSYVIFAGRAPGICRSPGVIHCWL